MKKVLSLLLVCTMIFSLAAFSVNAAGEGYSFTYYNLTVKSSGNPMTGYTYSVGYDSATTTQADITLYDGNYTNTSTSKAFALGVSANALSGSGHFVIEYDTTKVVPTVLIASANGFMGKVATDLGSDYTVDKTLTMNTATGPQGSASVSNSGYQVENGKIALTWMAASSTGGVNANETIAYIGFSLLANVTTDDFNADTFKIAADISDISDEVITAAAKESYGAMFLKGDANYGAKDSTLAVNFTYPGSDVTVGGGDSGEGDDDGEDEGDVAFEVTTPDSEKVTITYPTSVANRDAGTNDGAKPANYKAFFGKNTADQKIIGAKSTAPGAAGIVVPTLADGTSYPEYSAVFNGVTFYGKADVEVGQSWVIILVDPTGEILDAEGNLK